MATNEGKPGNADVTVTNWVACFNSGDDEVVLSCTVAMNDSSPGITGVGLILNDHQGLTLATCYTELSNGCQSANPSINLAAGNLKVGDRVMGVATGEANQQHFFFEEELVIGEC